MARPRKSAVEPLNLHRESSAVRFSHEDEVAGLAAAGAWGEGLSFDAGHLRSAPDASVDARRADDFSGRAVGHKVLLSRVDGFSWSAAILATQAELIKRGVRPAAEVYIRKEFVSRLRSECQVLGVEVIEYPISPEQVALFIYRLSHVGDVIRGLLALSDILPRAVRDWAWGKLFGYSDTEIERYVTRA